MDNRLHRVKMTDLLAPTIFETIKEEMPNELNDLKKVKGVILYEILKNGKSAGKWTMDLTNPPGDVYEGEPRNGVRPTVSVVMEDDIFVLLVAGELDPVKAFMSGKVKAKGNIMLLQKLTTIMKKVNAQAKL